MIKAEFRREGALFTGFKVSGHAGYAPEGQDVVCSWVSSAVQLVTNGVTEVFKIPAQVHVGEDTVEVSLPRQCEDAEASRLIQALHLHFTLLREEYPQHITVLEV